MGFDSPIIGYIVFGCIKLLGYTAFAIAIPGRYRTAQRDPTRNEAGEIDEDWTCRHCDYNQRGLHTAAQCPECGRTIAATTSTHNPASLATHVPNPWFVGLMRTLIGMGFGAVYWPLAAPRFAMLAFFPGLILVRFVEWWLLVAFFYDRRRENPRAGWRVAVIGTIVSYILDIPAAFGFIVVGGAWIC